MGRKHCPGYLVTKALVLVFLFLATLEASAQNKSGRYINPFGQMSITAGVGVAYYMGDLRDGLNMKHLGLGPSISLG